MNETRRSAHQNHPKKQCCIRIALMNQSNRLVKRLEKVMKFKKIPPWKIRNPTKQTVNNSEFGQGRYDRNRLKCSELDILHKLRLS